MKIHVLLASAALAATMWACSSSNNTETEAAAEDPVQQEQAEAEADINSITDEDAAAEQVATDVVEAEQAKAEAPAAEKAAPVAEKAAAVSAPVGGDVKALTNDNLLRPNTKVKKVTILDFNAVWCVPCKKFTPAFHEAAKVYGGSMDFYTVDVDQNPETAAAFGATSIPLVVIMRPDGTSRRFTGTGDILPAEKFLEIVKAEFK